MEKRQKPDKGDAAFQEFEREFLAALGRDFKTPALDRFNRSLVQRGADVSFLKDAVLEKQEYHRTYFQVSLARRKDARAQFAFLEENFDLLQDWWHVDQLTQFLHRPTLEFALAKAAEYRQDPRPYVRRWAYVLFIPALLKEPGATEALLPLFQDDKAYTVQMAEAWLLSFLAVQQPGAVFAFLKDARLDYATAGKAIQKICDSFRIPQEWKARFKSLRPALKLLP